MNKSQLKQRCKELLKKTVFDTDENLFLLSVFEMHPSFQRKAGSGILSITSQKTHFNNRCFYIHRTDGTCTDISYLRCIDGAYSQDARLRAACRSAILHEVQKVREGIIYGVDVCEISGHILTKHNTHIDHHNLSFDEVFIRWIKGQDIDFLLSQMNDTTEDNEMRMYFQDNDINTDFNEFHNKNTHLRAVTKHANLSLLKLKKDS